MRPRLEQRFRERLDETFDRKSKGETDETPDFSRVQTSWSDLSLVADGDLDESVRFTDIAGRIRNGADEELAALDQRMALVLERPGMESHDNPLSPMAICDAFRSALSVVESGPKLKKLLIRYFDQGVRFPGAEALCRAQHVPQGQGRAAHDPLRSQQEARVGRRARRAARRPRQDRPRAA